MRTDVTDPLWLCSAVVEREVRAESEMVVDDEDVLDFDGDDETLTEARPDTETLAEPE